MSSPEADDTPQPHRYPPKPHRMTSVDKSLAELGVPSPATPQDIEDVAVAARIQHEVAALSAREYRRLEKRLLLKMDIQIIGLCLTIYLLSFLDRTNIGQAKLLGLPTSLELSSLDYREALTILYVPYIIFEIPSNLVLKLAGPARWMPFLVTMWGIVALCQGLVHNKAGLLANRFFLGLTEAGILPGISLYLNTFFKPSELQLRQAMYFSGASLAGAFGALIAAAVNDTHTGGLEPWSWLFIIEGMATVIIGLACFVLLPNGIDKLRGLSGLERDIAFYRIGKGSGQMYALGQLHEAQSQGILAALKGVSREGNEDLDKVLRSFSARDVRRAFVDPLVLLLNITLFLAATGLYSFALFAPTIVKSLNLKDGKLTLAESLLLVTPPFAVAFVVSIALAVISDRMRWRAFSAMVAAILAVIGFAMAYAGATPATKYVGLFFLAAGVFSSPSVYLSWIATSCWGYYKRATAIAFAIVFTNSGGILSTWLFPDMDAPSFQRGFLTNVIFSVLVIPCIGLLELYIWYDRRAKTSGKYSHRVSAVEERFPGATREQIREYLGDEDPDFMREY